MHGLCVNGPPARKKRSKNGLLVTSLQNVFLNFLNASTGIHLIFPSISTCSSDRAGTLDISPDLFFVTSPPPLKEPDQKRSVHRDRDLKVTDRSYHSPAENIKQKQPCSCASSSSQPMPTACSERSWPARRVRPSLD